MTAYQRALFLRDRRRRPPDPLAVDPPEGSTRGLWAAILFAALGGCTLWAVLGLWVFREVAR
jgi:hypothetical protein